MRKFATFFILVNVAVFFFLTGCAKIPKDALKLNPKSLKQRQIQTRKYETTDETRILVACATLLQDLGFNLDESETELGVIVASKMRSALDFRQHVTAFIAMSFAIYLDTDEKQQMTPMSQGFFFTNYY